jgi:hypothetical protein
MCLSDRFLFETFEAIKKRVPDILDHVKRLGGTENVAKAVSIALFALISTLTVIEMRDAGNNDRDVLVHEIKDNISSWTRWSIPVARTLRGYADASCAAFIAPYTCDPSDPG